MSARDVWLWLWWWLLLGLGITNAYLVGRSWAAAAFFKGWPRLVAWIGAATSVASVCWCSMFALPFFLGLVFGGEGPWETWFLFVAKPPLLAASVFVFGWLCVLAAWADSWRCGVLPVLPVTVHHKFSELCQGYKSIRIFGFLDSLAAPAPDMKSPGLPSVSSAPAPPPLPAEPKQQSESKGINPWSILLAVIVTSSITGLVGLFLLAVIGAIGIAGGLIALQVIFFLAGNTPLPNGPRTAIESNKNGVRR